ncbi:MAG: nitroreductase family protein [Oscillospiraceae bacterium]|jgi:nitroreductase|nr:nitroreductase family protein [Oscillospiraceae bacterium]
MDLTQAILLRKSRRSYKDEPIPQMQADALLRSIDELNAQSGLHIQLVTDKQAFASIRKNYGFFKNVPAYFVLAGNESDPKLHEKVGYYGELLVLEATRLGLGTCWVGSTYDKAQTKAELAEGERVVCVVSVGVAAGNDTLRERTIYSMIHTKSKKLEDLYECDETPPPAWFLSAMNAVLRAPSARNKQPVRIIYKDGKIEAATGEFQVNKIDLGIAKCHFDLECKNGFQFKNEL